MGTRVSGAVQGKIIYNHEAADAECFRCEDFKRQFDGEGCERRAREALIKHLTEAHKLSAITIDVTKHGSMMVSN